MRGWRVKHLKKVLVLIVGIVTVIKFGEDAWGTRYRSDLVLHRLEQALQASVETAVFGLGHPPVEGRALIRAARIRFAEGRGYLSVGKAKESRERFRAALESTLGYVRLAPRGEHVAEGLVILARSIRALEGAGSIRAALVLDICDDLFPGTVWGDVAHQIRRRA